MNPHTTCTQKSPLKISIWAKALLISLTAMLASQTGLVAGHNNSVDGDGCWDARTNSGGNCMVVQETYWRGSKFVVKYRNACSYRIYARFCNERRSGSEDCGASGISPGRTKTWYTYEANGRYNYISVGSDIGSKDWVCAGKVRGWGD